MTTISAGLSLIGFLITNPVRTIVLHEPGIPFTVPAPERFVSCALSNTSLRAPLRNAFQINPAEVNRFCEALVLARCVHAPEYALSDAQLINHGILGQVLPAPVQGLAGEL